MFLATCDQKSRRKYYAKAGIQDRQLDRSMIHKSKHWNGASKTPDWRGDIGACAATDGRVSSARGDASVGTIVG